MLDYAQFALFKHELESIIDTGKDSLRFYRLGNNWRNKVEHFGTKEGYDPEGFLLSD
jgi:CRISPR-associated protein Cas2